MMLPVVTSPREKVGIAFIDCESSSYEKSTALSAQPPSGTNFRPE